MKKLSILIGLAFVLGACAPGRSLNADGGLDIGPPDTLIIEDDRGPDYPYPYPDFGPPPPGCGAPAPLDPVCGQALCGNGALDSCESCSGGGGGGGADAGGWYPDMGPPCYTETEACDGANLGGATCASLGYAGGTLKCSADCRLDVSGCGGCATNSTIATCVHPVESQPVQGFEIATTATQVGLAWIGGHASQARRYLNFTLFDAQLQPVAKVLCIGDADPSSVSIARVSGHWMIASGTTSSTAIFLIDDASLVPTKVREVAGAFGPTLIGRPQGGPLLTFYDSPDGRLVGTLLDEKGNEQWRTQLLDRTYGAGTSGVFTGSAFLVTDRRSAYYSDLGGVRVINVDLAGKVIATSSPGGTDTEFPNLSWHGKTARIVWVDFGSPTKMFMAQLDAKGQRIGNAIELPYGKSHFNWVRTLPKNDDLFALFAGYTGWVDYGTHLDFATLGPGGATLTPMVQLTKSPESAKGHRLALLGAKAVAAWIDASTPPRLGLALLDL